MTRAISRCHRPTHFKTSHLTPQAPAHIHAPTIDPPAVPPIHPTHPANQVTPGNIVAIVPGHNRRHNDPAVSRNIALQYLAKPIVEKGELLGYDEKLHQLVIPRTPFKPGTRDHWPDKGAHITVRPATYRGRFLDGSTHSMLARVRLTNT